VFRIRDIFILSFIFFTVSTIVLFFIKRQPPVEKDAKAWKLELPRSFPEATLLLFLTGAAIAVSITSPFLPLYFHDIFSLQPASIQLLGAAQSLGSATFAILLSKRADTASRGRTMATGLLLSTSGILGIALTGNPLFVFPLVFLFGSARAPSLIAYSILSNIRHGASRAGQYGFFLTLESLGFVGGSYLGGVLYTINPAIGLYTTAGVFLTLAIVAALTKFQSKHTLWTLNIDIDGKEFKAAPDKPEGIDGPV
jgi:MFS family permease